MLITLMASYFIVYSEQFSEYLINKTNSQMAALRQNATQEKVEIQDLKYNFSSVSKWLSMAKARYIILVYHALLNFILIFDSKDFIVMIVFAIESMTVPVHLYLYMKASPAHTKLRHMYYTFLPVFSACMFLVLFRYLLYFQK